MRDELTGLPGKDLLEDRLEHALERARRGAPLAVMAIEVDGFEALRAKLGPDATDTLIAELVPRLAAGSRTSDTLGRTGQSEFIVICERVESLRNLRLIAERLLAGTASPLPLPDGEQFLSVSIGVTVPDGMKAAAPGTLEAARAAMRSASEQGGGRYELDPGLRDRLAGSLELERELFAAIAREELRLYYQPTYGLSDGKIGSLEGLLRWDHPDRGIVAPSEFMDAVAQSDVVVELGQWAVDEACRQLAAWRPSLESAALYLAVNVSGEQLLRADLLDRLRHSLESSVAPAAHLALEISAEDLAAVPDSVIDRLAALGELGVSVVIDQVSTGRVPLERTKGLPVRAVKLSGELVAGLPDDSRCTSMARDAITAAKKAGAETIAQGVESPGQVETLRELGCDSVAGFLLSVPMPADAVEDALRGQVRPVAASA